MLKHFGKEDEILSKMLPHMQLLRGIDPDRLAINEKVRSYTVSAPTEEWQFLHEAAVIEHKGLLYVAWYNNPERELNGRTPIRWSTSEDEGKTWTDPKVLADDESAKILYCPPVFGVEDGKLYMFINEMVSADHMHALDLYVLNEEKAEFERLWSRPIPFKLNTNVYRLSNGKLMLPGRIAELDGFPNTPAVLISDSGRINAEWRLVHIAPDGALPDGAKYVHPELSAVIDGETVWIFCRNDERKVPIVYVSKDNGETWSAPVAHDIPFSGSKIYSGTLSDGRNYVIGNLYPGRDRLAIFFSRVGEMQFDEGFLLQDGYSKELGYGGPQWSYPVAHEWNGKLYVIYSAHREEGNRRGAAISVIPLQ